MAFAGRTLDRIASWPRSVVVMCGTYTGNGTSNMTTFDFKGGSAAVRNSVGDYSITIPGAPEIYAIFASCESPDGALTDAHKVVHSYNSATGVLTLHATNAAATNALADFATDQKLHLLILARGSSVNTGQ